MSDAAYAIKREQDIERLRELRQMLALRMKGVRRSPRLASRKQSMRMSRNTNIVPDTPATFSSPRAPSPCGLAEAAAVRRVHRDEARASASVSLVPGPRTANCFI